MVSTQRAIHSRASCAAMWRVNGTMNKWSSGVAPNAAIFSSGKVNRSGHTWGRNKQIGISSKVSAAVCRIARVGLCLQT